MPNIGSFPEVGYPKPFILGGANFIPEQQTYDWLITGSDLRNDTSLTPQHFHTNYLLPNGVTVNKITLYGFRNDALAEMTVRFYRFSRDGTTELMCDVIADWTDGDGSLEQSTINYPVIDNENYAYAIRVTMDPNDATSDIKFRFLRIDWK